MLAKHQGNLFMLRFFIKLSDVQEEAIENRTFRPEIHKIRFKERQKVKNCEENTVCFFFQKPRRGKDTARDSVAHSKKKCSAFPIFGIKILRVEVGDFYCSVKIQTWS